MGSAANAHAASLARSETEAHFIVAARNPRSMDVVRADLLKDCRRPIFADVAMYEVPRAGRKIRGLSIRFAEAALRHMGNIVARASVVYEDEERMICRIQVLDYEKNASEVDDVSIPKTTEKRHPKDGDEVLSQRVNSTGQTTYLVRATADEMRIRRRSETQRAKRNAILALLPGDLLDECKRQIGQTAVDSAASDPDAYRKQVVDGFAQINVPADQLARYLGHDLGTASPAELAELKAVYATVRDGEASWHECLAAKTGVEADRKSDPHASVKAAVAAKAAKAKGRGKGKAKAKPKAAPASAPTEPAPEEPPPEAAAAAAADDDVPPGFEREDDGTLVPMGGGS
jgi:hypothetical protein